MWQRCKQVAIFYLTQKVLLVLLSTCLLVSSPLVFFADRWPDQFSLVIGRLFPPQYLGFVLGAYLMMFGILLGGHLKQQFANSRSRLLPGFCGAHLSVAMLLFFAGVAWSALPACWTPGASVLGYSAISLHLGGLGLFLLWSPRPVGIAVVMLTIGLPATAVGRGLVAEIATGAEPMLAISLISAHVASLVLLRNHLVGMNEDDPDYSKYQPLNGWDMRAATQRNFQRNVSPSNNWLSNMIEGRAATRFERATSAPATTPSQRVTLFGLGDNWSSGVWVAQIMFGLIEVVVLLMGGRDSIQTSQGFRMAMITPMIILSSQTLGPWMTWMGRRAGLGYESLRPVSRREWVWENGIAIAKKVVLNQASVILMQVLIVALFLPQFLTEPVLWEAVIWFTGCQVLVFGISAWLTSYGSLWLLVGVVGFSGIVFLPLRDSAIHYVWGIPLMAYLSLVVSLIGVWLSRLAFKRWCLIDLP